MTCLEKSVSKQVHTWSWRCLFHLLYPCCSCSTLQTAAYKGGKRYKKRWLCRWSQHLAWWKQDECCVLFSFHHGQIDSASHQCNVLLHHIQNHKRLCGFQ